MAFVLASVVVIGACAKAGTTIAGISVATGTNISRIAAEERRTAPAIQGETLDGATLDATYLAGKVAVVNFWGSWCGPCRLEEPILEEAWGTLKDEGVVFLGVNTRRDQRAAAIAFQEEFGVTYPSLYDPDSTTAYAFGVRVMPATFILDADGKIAAQVVGAVRSAAELEGLVREAAA